MNTRLLAVLTQAEGADVLANAIARHLAKPDPPEAVTVLQLCDGQYTDRVCGKLREDGWMSGRQSEALGRTLNANYLDRFDEVTQELVAQLEGNGVDVRQLRRGGDLVNTVLRTAESEGPISRILVAQPRAGLFKRWFSGVNARVLVDRAPCPVEVVEWSG